MVYSCYINKVSRWHNLNDYEGQINAIIYGVNLFCHVFCSNEEEWGNLNANTHVDIDITFERNGLFVINKTQSVHMIENIDGIKYRISGKVIKIENETILISSIFLIEVDLDLPFWEEDIRSQIKIGDTLEVEGIFKI